MHMTEFMAPATRDGMRQLGCQPQYWQREWDNAPTARLWNETIYPPFFDQLTVDTKRYFLGAGWVNNTQLARKNWERWSQRVKKRYFLPPPPMQTGEMAQANLYLVQKK